MQRALPKWVVGVRWAFLAGTVLFLAGILLQAYLAGRGLFGVSSFAPHMDLGWPLAHAIAPLLLVLSFLTRVGAVRHVVAALAYVLALLLPILPTLRADAPEAAALHPLLALAIFGLLLWLALDLARAMRQRPTSTP